MQDNHISTEHIDGLRIVAAGAVVVLHYADYIKDTPVGRALVEHTWHFNLFVDLFFVISGFVIASQYLGKVDSAASIGRFLWRRLARIYPLHLATLAFYVLIAVALQAGIASSDNPARYPLSDLPAQLLLLHAVIGERLTFNFPSWSLSAEFFCYVLFPVLALLAARRRTAVLVLVALLLIGNTVYALAAGTEPWPDWINRGGAFRALPAFALGMACWLYRNRIAAWRALPGLFAAALLLFVAIGAYLPIMAALALVYAIALLGIHHDLSAHHSWFARSGLARWSELTFSIYMLHIPVATLVLTLAARFLAPLLPGGKLALVPLAVLLLVIASLLSLRLFETPIRHALNAAYDRRSRWRLAGGSPGRQV